MKLNLYLETLMSIFRKCQQLALLALIALSAVQPSVQTRIHNAILVIDTSYNKVHWLVGTPYLSIKASNDDFRRSSLKRISEHSNFSPEIFWAQRGTSSTMDGLTSESSSAALNRSSARLYKERDGKLKKKHQF